MWMQGNPHAAQTIFLEQGELHFRYLQLFPRQSWINPTWRILLEHLNIWLQLYNLLPPPLRAP